MVDKMFAFCPINPDRTDKKIHEISGIVTNMTMLGVHFKISSNGKNPFEKHKQWGKAKKDKEEFWDPIIFFLLAIATDKDPEDLLLRIIHEWQRHGGILLRIKELQSFKSNTILAFYNIFTATPKNIFCKNSIPFSRKRRRRLKNWIQPNSSGPWQISQTIALSLH